jgi:uncharacterized protein (TIGR02145 family)
MNKLYCLAFLGLFFSTLCHAQDIEVTFRGPGESRNVQWVTATNLTTGESLKIRGIRTLILSPTTGLASATSLTSSGIVYPNPFSGHTTLSTMFKIAQTVEISIHNLEGQLLTTSTVNAQAGHNVFSVFVSQKGIYLVRFVSEDRTACYKVVCQEANGGNNRIQYLGLSLDHHISGQFLKTESMYTQNILGYQIGDLVLYKCTSEDLTTIITDSPTESKRYLIEFAACFDGAGKSYPTVKIGEQIWMAENLAYLPQVSPAINGSNDSAYYYVYGYEGTSVDDAKDSTNYQEYGVLYNWEGAIISCPSGWHLPETLDWSVLTKFLDWSAGNKLKETGGRHWAYWKDKATNESGFSARGAGIRSEDGIFQALRIGAKFWTSSELDSTNADSKELFFRGNFLAHQEEIKSTGASVRCIKDQ